ncbi:MAG: FkbM family methyltransferase [Methanobrevibacter sp.]|jgi:FkbM family methyltransferase|nr:FkbM family methyltransferase [Candidatus Methanoflexus mossambicus]
MHNNTHTKCLISYDEDHEEDLILFSYLMKIDKGFYIDVGANHPIKGSVTKLFYDLGWSGINIEPLPDMYFALCEDRPRDININLGAGSKNEKLSFFVADGRSTFDLDAKKLAKSSYSNGKDITIDVKPLTDIIMDNIDINNVDIHFCKIDVENFEKEVLKGIDFNLIRPWVFCIESTVPGTTIPNYDEWEDILFDAGYYFLCSKDVNRFYGDINKKMFLEENNNLEDYEIFYPMSKSNNLRWKIGNFILKPIVYLFNKYNNFKFNKFYK